MAQSILELFHKNIQAQALAKSEYKNSFKNTEVEFYNKTDCF